MTQTIRRLGSLLLACLLTIPLLCGSAAHAEYLLEAMTDIALRAGRTIEGTIRIEAANLPALLSSGQDGSGAAALAVAGDVLNNGLLRVRYTQEEERRTIGVTLELRGETVVSLDVRALSDAIAVETSLLPGKTLVMPAQLAAELLAAEMPSALDDETLGAFVGVAERYALIAADWAAQSEGVFSATEAPVAATQTRDAAARSMTLRVTDAQWQALCLSLAEAFSKDDVLLQALAPLMGGAEPDALATAARQWAESMGAPQGVAVEASVFLGESDRIVGVDARIEPTAAVPEDASNLPVGSFAYSHRSIDADRAADSYEASFAWGEDSALQAKFSRLDKMPRPLLPAEGEEYGGRALLRTPSAGALELMVQGDIRRTVEPIAETYDHTFDARLSQATESSDGTDALAQMLQAPLLEAGFTLSSQTEAIGTDDFRSQGSFALRLLGLETAVRYTLESSLYTPAEHLENTVVRLDALAPAEMDALLLELKENALLLLANLASLKEKPPALQTYAVDGESVPSIDSIVGFREITDTETGVTGGNPYVSVSYQTAGAFADIQAYIDFLLNSGWAVTGLAGDDSDGMVQVATESGETGKLLMITADFTTDTYSILLRKTDGTLTRHTDGSELGEVTITGGNP